MTVLRIRGFALPEGEPIDLYADGDRWTTDPVPGAELVAEGWVLPGLVDAHTHPGADARGTPMKEDLLREDLHAHVAAGVTMIRAPGLAGEPPEWFGRDDDVPRAVHAGPWIAQHGQFFDGWGHRAAPEDMPAIAAEQAARTGWAKLICDWGPGDPPISTDALRAVAEAVHAVGGRIAVHSQHPEGGSAAVAAGVPAHTALGAASWTARAYLGLAGLAEGAPADAVVYESDPRTDLGQLAHPRAVVLRGRRV